MKGRSEVAADKYDLSNVTEFMKALTDPSARNLAGVVPGRVPSGPPMEGKR